MATGSPQLVAAFLARPPSSRNARIGQRFQSRFLIRISSWYGTVRSIVRISGWTGNTALTVDAEFFGRDRPRVGFRDRHGEIRGLTVEEYINRLGQDLIPLAERCARVMREAIAALETLRAAPSGVVERSKPISFSVRW